MKVNGLDVYVFQAFHRNEQLELQGVKYFFVKSILSQLPIPFQVHWKINHHVKKYISEIQHTNDNVAVHINGLIFPLNVLFLSYLLHDKVKFMYTYHFKQNTEITQIIWLFALNKTN